MSNQTDVTYVTIEQLVSQSKQANPPPIVVDILTLVRAVTHNVTLVKQVWTGIIFDDFNIFAAFGPPESDQWLVTLAAEE